MKFSTMSAYLAVSAIALVSAIPTAIDATRGQLRTVHQFPNRTWIENMAIRKNGQILGTDIANSRIYLVDPQNPVANPPVVAQFPNATLIAGIVEMQDDVFYAQSAEGRLYTFEFFPNTSAIWKVDMRNYAKSGAAEVTKVADLPQVLLPNGMTVLSKKQETILIGDSPGGKVWRACLKTGAYEPVLTGPNVQPIPGTRVPFGVNGVQVVNGNTLYYVNTNKGLLVKVPIDSNGRPTGPETIISSQVPNADDFAIDSRGNFFIAQNVLQTLVRVTPSGQVTTVAGGQNSTELYGPVAARFGRGKTDRDVLYIATDGLAFSSTGAPISNAGKIAAIRP